MSTFTGFGLEGSSRYHVMFDSENTVITYELYWGSTIWPYQEPINGTYSVVPGLCPCCLRAHG